MTPEQRLEYYRTKAKARSKRVRQATPPWVTTRELMDIYSNCPEGYHVDHIIPLKGEFVSGLHTPANLQYLPAEENLRKSNKCPL